MNNDNDGHHDDDNEDDDNHDYDHDNDDDNDRHHDRHPRHLLLHLLCIDLAHVAIPIGLPHLPGTEHLQCKSYIIDQGQLFSRKFLVVKHFLGLELCWSQLEICYKTLILKKKVLGGFMNYICFMFWHHQSFTLSVPDVKVPGVVLVVGDVDPVVVGDHPLVQRQDGLVPGLDPAHLWRQTVDKG